MADIVITDLSNSVLDALRKRGLLEQSIHTFERYGISPIFAEFRAIGSVVYSAETVKALVWREWEKVKEALLPRYQWAHLRRAGVYFEQMANSGKIQELRMPKWEAENNPLFLSADPNPEKANDIETVICLTRDQVQSLDLGSKAKSNYLYCGFGAILKYFEARGESAFSQETLDACIAEAFGKWKNGEMSLTMWQNIRKTALWIKEYRNTGMITHRRLSNVEFGIVQK